MTQLGEGGGRNVDHARARGGYRRMKITCMGSCVWVFSGEVSIEG